MTTTDFYPPREIEQSPHTSDESHVLQRGESIYDKLMQSTYEQAMAAVADITDEEIARANAVFPRLIEVTEQEEEAWLEKMQRLAGCVA